MAFGHDGEVSQVETPAGLLAHISLSSWLLIEKEGHLSVGTVQLPFCPLHQAGLDQA